MQEEFLQDTELKTKSSSRQIERLVSPLDASKNVARISFYESLAVARKDLLKSQELIVIEDEQLSVKEFRNTFIIWVQFNNKTSGIERRDNLEKLYGVKIANALNIDKVRMVKSDFGLQLYQPDTPMIADIAFRELIFLRENKWRIAPLN